VEGDFLENNLTSQSFDFVVGKAFLHHLNIPTEKLFLKETARLLKLDGEARFFEPAVNNKVLDQIRWLIPVKNRPSKLQFKAFKKWKEEDPHPDRTYSSRHFEKVGKDFFEIVETYMVGTLERFNKFITPGKKRNSFKKWALKREAKLPLFLNRSLSRSQLIIYRKPLRFL
jgi:ubiquinone/menaquinone biosynthesis C-methylase UbiE